MGSLALSCFPCRDKLSWADKTRLPAWLLPKWIKKMNQGLGGRARKSLRSLSQKWEGIVWPALGFNGVLFWILQAAQQKRRQSLLQASPPLPKQDWLSLKIAVGPHNATSCSSGLSAAFVFSDVFSEWNYGEGNQQHPAKRFKSDWSNSSRWNVGGQGLHCCMDHLTRMPKNKRNLFSAVQWPEKMWSRINKNIPVTKVKRGSISSSEVATSNFNGPLL